MRRWLITLTCAALVVLLGAIAAQSRSTRSAPTAAAPTTATPSLASYGTAQRGGVYRTAVSSFGLTDGLDPTGETQIGFAWAIYDATSRTLVDFKHVPGNAGLVPTADLATTVPKPTDGGLTYTFHLKKNIKWGPPLNREITSQDIEYAFQRINDATLVPQYGYYYNGVIKGLTGKAKNPDARISGISTPNPTTIVFHLSTPTGDFLQRLASPAATPIPQEVAKCFLKPGDYGRDLISSGPYMFAGEQNINISSCSTIKAISGFDPTRQITLVRNPNYVQSTDTTRANYLDGVSISVDPNVSDIFDRVSKGELDGSMTDPPPAVVTQKYLTSSSLKKNFHSDEINQGENITMNLDVAPFTDIHVRKAVAWVLDKSAMLAALGGSSHYTLATHIIPPTLLGGLPASYDPYKTPNESGDLAKAQAEMKLSAFDPKKDGKCDVAACKNLVFINTEPFTPIDPVVQADLAKIGIGITTRDLSVSTAFGALFTIKNRTPMSPLGGGYADYTGVYSFAQPNFGSTAMSGPVECCNYSLMGLTKAQAKKFGVPYPAGGIPNVDAQINKCEALLFGTARNTCWENFDKYMMTKVMVWVPYIWGRNIVITGPTVTRYLIDEATTTISLTQIAVNNKVKPA
jgi:peptide/nickel transport system substrate-binding protein